MEETTPREKILKKVRKALLNKAHRESISQIDFEAPVYVRTEDSLDLTFAQNFTESGGKFFFCANTVDLADNLEFLLKEKGWSSFNCQQEIVKELLDIAEIPYTWQHNDAIVSIRTCDYLIARTGGIVINYEASEISDSITQSRYVVLIGFTSQLVFNLNEAFNSIKAEREGKLPPGIQIISNSGGLDYQGQELKAEPELEIYFFLMDNTDESEEESASHE
jgi:L-lactate dehydrogenase complex protein LldG